MAIAQLTWSESDPEGGSSTIAIYPSGYVQASGHPSCCGYKPRMTTGWYRVTKMDALQQLFDDAASILERDKHVRPPERERGHWGMETETTALVDGRNVPLAMFFETEELGLAAIAAKPADLDTPKVAAHLPASSHVRGVLFERNVQEVPRLSRAQVELVLKQLRARVARNRDQSLLDFIGELLAKIDPSCVDMLPPLIDEPRFVPVDVVIAALGAHGPAARAHAGLVHANARKSDATLIAASVALARIGGDDAEKWLQAELIPALGGAPKEPNLDLFYRVRFAEALVSIERPAATQLLTTRVYPDLERRLDAAMKKQPPSLGDASELFRVLRARLPETFLARDLPRALERALAQTDVGARQLALRAMYEFYKPGRCAPELERVLGAVTDPAVRPNADEVRSRLCTTH